MRTPPPATGRLPLPGLTQPLRGLPARAAAAAGLQERRKVSIRALPAGTALNRCTSSRMPFNWTLNPYRGCEYGCVYCYARYTHTYMGLHEPADFETRIFAKADMPGRLAHELRRMDLTGEHLAIGTVTDPYQPAERRLEITRRMLAAFRHVRGITLSITTKSDLVSRDIDLLLQIHRHNRVHINVTVITMETALARSVEPQAPRPDLRLSALAQLRQAGLEAGVFAMPILPGLTDGDRQLNLLAAGVAASGGRYLCAQPLFVRSCVRPTLYGFLAGLNGDLLQRYRRAFAADGNVSRDYRLRLQQRVTRIRAAHGLAAAPGSGDESRPQP